MTWKCPSCGFEDNEDSITRCSCGHELPIRQKTNNKKICARKITKGSLYKLLLIGISIPFSLFFLICGIASMFGANTVHWGEKPITGIMGLISAVLMYPVFCLIFAGLAWLCIAFGLWIYSKFRTIELFFVDDEVVPETLAKNIAAQPLD
jgi:hypothetical protein